MSVTMHRAVQVNGGRLGTCRQQLPQQLLRQVCPESPRQPTREGPAAHACRRRRDWRSSRSGPAWRDAPVAVREFMGMKRHAVRGIHMQVLLIIASFIYPGGLACRQRRRLPVDLEGHGEERGSSWHKRCGRDDSRRRHARGVRSLTPASAVSIAVSIEVRFLATRDSDMGRRAQRARVGFERRIRSRGRSMSYFCPRCTALREQAVVRHHLRAARVSVCMSVSPGRVRHLASESPAPTRGFPLKSDISSGYGIPHSGMG